MSPHSASRLLFFCHLHRALRIFLFQSREPTQHITITFLLLPTQGITNFPLSITWAHTAHHDYHSFVAHTAYDDSPFLITWANPVHHVYHSFGTHTGQSDSPLLVAWTHPAPHHPFLLLPTQGITILHFQSSALIWHPCIISLVLNNANDVIPRVSSHVDISLAKRDTWIISLGIWACLNRTQMEIFCWKRKRYFDN